MAFYRPSEISPPSTSLMVRGCYPESSSLSSEAESQRLSVLHFDPHVMEIVPAPLALVDCLVAVRHLPSTLRLNGLHAQRVRMVFARMALGWSLSMSCSLSELVGYAVVLSLTSLSNFLMINAVT